MKLLGLLLLLSGWGIIVAAVLLLHSSVLPIFVVAGGAVELLGLALFARAHIPAREDTR